MNIISIVIPMYNEQRILNNTITQVDTYLRSHFGENYEIIASDDGSTDGTFNMLENLCGKFPRLRVVTYPDRVNRGKGAAVRNGILQADGDIIIFTDCDLSYGTDVITRIVKIFRSNSDIDLIIGSRNLSDNGYAGYTFARKLMSKLYIKLLSTFAGLRYTDSQSGIKGFRREAARRIFKMCEIDRFAFDMEVLMIADKLEFNVREFDVKIIEHSQTGSKVKIVKDTIRMLHDVNRIRKRLNKK